MGTGGVCRNAAAALASAFALLAAPLARGENLVISGSGNPEYVLTQLAGAFNQAQAAHTVSIPPTSGTAGALRDVEAGTTPMGRVGRPLKEEERKRGLVYVPLGRDPVAFVGGAGVTARSITQQQALDVYSGRITDWRELGGKPGPIRAIGRESTDASRQALARLIPPFAALAFGEGVKLVHLDAQLIELLDRFPTSLGFLNRSAIKATRTGVVPLALDGVQPDAANLEAGRYPLWLEFGLIHKTDAPSGAGKAFIDFVRSPAGVALLRAHGVLAVKAAG